MCRFGRIGIGRRSRRRSRRRFAGRREGVGRRRRRGRSAGLAFQRVEAELGVTPELCELFLKLPDAEAVLLILSGQRRHLFFKRRSEEHTSELQSLMRISYAVFCLKKKTK